MVFVSADMAERRALYRRGMRGVKGDFRTVWLAASRSAAEVAFARRAAAMEANAEAGTPERATAAVLDFGQRR